MFAAYSVMSLSPTGGHLVIGNLSGTVKVLPLPYHGMYVLLFACTMKPVDQNTSIIHTLSYGPK